MPPTIPIDDRLRVIEIYPSVKGEYVGGSPLCFCATRWLQPALHVVRLGMPSVGEHQSIQNVVEEACSFGIQVVEVTGGEPLLKSKRFH